MVQISYTSKFNTSLVFFLGFFFRNNKLIYILLCRFHTTKSSWGYDIKISNCSHSDDSGCPLFMSTRGQAIPFLDSPDNVNCSSVTGSECSLHVQRPPTNDWNYVRIRSNQNGGNGSIQFNLAILLTG